MVALKKIMVSEWRRASSQRRGGGEIHVPVDTAFAESRYAADPQAGLPPDAAYDRKWAITLHDLTLGRLQNEFVAAGKPEEFEALKECLMTNPRNCPQCGAQLPANAKADLCPSCVMAMNIGTQTELTGEFGPHETKVLNPKPPSFAERFTREARALAKLNHPHIVTIYEFGQTDDGSRRCDRRRDDDVWVHIRATRAAR